MKRITACLVVLVSVLLAPPARGQTPGPTYWSPWEVRPVESAGEVVFKFTTRDPGRTEYYTKDGDCSGYPSAEDPANETPLSPAECGRPYARAGEDYGAVRGEWTFTEPGSRTVRIPIIDDNVDETDLEAFTINAAHQADGWAVKVLYNATIRIRDDDPKDDSDPRDDGDASPPVVITTVVTRAEQRPTGSSTVDTAPQPVPTTVASPPPDLAVALPSAELEPGPGFELVIERDPEPPAERDDRSGGSASALALGLGTTALGSGGVLWLRRQRRWSPTRS